MTLSLNDEEVVCYEPGVVFDSEAFFQRMREDSTLVMKTSMVNTSAFLSAFEPHLQAGEDVLYLGMAGGISGTCGAGKSRRGNPAKEISRAQSSAWSIRSRRSSARA